MRFLKKRDKQFFSKAHSKTLKHECRDEKAEPDTREFQRPMQSNRMELATPTRTHEENEHNNMKNCLDKKKHCENLF